MKKIVENGFSVFIIIMLLFVLLPFNVMANESNFIADQALTEDELIVNNLETNSSGNVSFTSRYKNGFFGKATLF